MTHTPTHQRRTLAVAPTTRGFGFAVLEGESKLVDWGVRAVTGNKNVASIKGAKELISKYTPEVLVIENYKMNASRRSARIQGLRAGLAKLAKSAGIHMKESPGAEARNAIVGTQAGTKQALAEKLTELYPEELGYLLPRKRRPWMGEDYRMAIFEAVALALLSPSQPTPPDAK